MLSDDLLLLKIVDSNGSIDLLLKRGLTFSQIANKIQQQIKKENIYIDRYELHLTSKGERLLKDSFKELHLSKKDTWIVPQDYYYHEPINEYYIVLPKKL